jgi:L-ascorbate metabolism protein UlaG (beta-lactamase superfamily)
MSFIMISLSFSLLFFQGDNMKILITLCTVCFVVFLASAQGEVQIEYYGHSCFRLVLPDGFKIVFDPFDPDELKYFYPDQADLVISSHTHFDHNFWQKLHPSVYALANGRKNDFTVIEKGAESQKTGTLRADNGKVSFYTVPSFHDDKGGIKRGANGIICLQVEGMKFVHLGDLGTALSPEQIKAIGKPDVLFLPVGGNFTISAETAMSICNQLFPKLVVPMHYMTDRLDPHFGIVPVDTFAKKVQNKRYLTDWKLKVSTANLPKDCEVYIMNYHP